MKTLNLKLQTHYIEVTIIQDGMSKQFLKRYDEIKGKVSEGGDLDLSDLR